MEKRIVVIQGHPDAKSRHFGHALSDAYTEAARSAGHHVHLVEIARVEFPVLRSKDDFDHEPAPEPIRICQEQIQRADHVVIFYPLWLGAMPALLKAFLEQLFRPGFAFSGGDGGRMKALLHGKTARVVVTMGMPAFFYRWYFGAHGIKSLERSILAFVGFNPIKATLIGMVESVNTKTHQKWLSRVAELGRAAD